MAPKGGKWYSYALRENAFGVATQLATFVAGVAFTIIFPNLLGMADFGKLSLVLAVAHISVALASLGMTGALLRFIPVGLKQGNSGGYFRHLLLIQLGLGLLLSAGLFLGADTIASLLFSLPEIAGGLRLASLFVFFASMFTFADSTLVSLKRTGISLGTNSIYQISRVVIPIALYAWLGDYAWVVVGMAIAYVIPLQISVFFLGRENGLSQFGKKAVDRGAVWSYLAFGGVGMIAGLLTQWSDTLIVGAFAPPEGVALYRVAWLWATSVVFLMPFSARIMAAMHAYESAERSRKALEVSLRYAFLFSFLIIAGTISVADRFLLIAYGESYSAAYPILVAFSIVVIEITLTGIISPFLTGKGDARTPALLNMGHALLLAGLAYLAASMGLGLVWIAAGASVARVLGGLAVTAVALRRIRLVLPASYALKPAFSALVSTSLVLFVSGYAGAGILQAFALGVLAVVSFLAVSFAIGGLDIKELRKIAKAVA